VLHERRKAIHERTAQAMEALYRATLDDYYSELAYHYTRSGNTQKAVEYLRLAGEQAAQRSANAEALTHLTTALELLNTLPDTPERAQQELTLQIARGAPLAVSKGNAAPEVEHAYTRARELCQQLGQTPQLFPVLGGLWQFYLTRAEYQRARELGEQFLTLAQEAHDPALLLAAQGCAGTDLLFPRRVCSGPGPPGAGPHWLRSPAAPRPDSPAWGGGPGSSLPLHGGRRLVVTGLSRSSPAEDS
jgi:predicted ATPase